VRNLHSLMKYITMESFIPLYGLCTANHVQWSKGICYTTMSRISLLHESEVKLRTSVKNKIPQAK